MQTKTRFVRMSWPARIIFLGIGFVIAGAATYSGIGGNFIGLGVVLVLIGLGGLAFNNDQRIIRTSPSGSVRIVTTKASRVNGEIGRYSAAGWSVEGQSTAKSLGSQPQVTLTFRKK